MHKNFPTEKESGSEANRLAIWWASNKNVETGDQTLISMNNRWYLVEKFDDADNNYQVEAFITKAEYNKIFKEIQEYGRSGKIKSIQTSTNVIDKLNQSKYSLKGRKSSSISDETKYGTENNSIQRVGEEQVEGRERFGSNGRGNSEGGGQDRQRDSINYSLKDSEGNTLTEAQQEFFKDSKVRDEDGNLLVVYHQTNGKIYVNEKTGQQWDKLSIEERDIWEERDDWNKYWKEKDFYIFDTKKGRQSIEMPAIFFSPNYDEYHEYGDRTIKSYLLLKNPAYNPNIENAGVTNTAGVDAMQKLIEQGYDGFIRTNEEGNIEEYAVFDQAKLTTNKNPTSNKDIRFSLKSFSDSVNEIATMTDKDALSTKAKGEFISVMKHTPSVVLDNVKNAEDLEVIIRFDALYLALRKDGIIEGHYHNLGKEVLADLPKYISSPDAIVKLNNGRLNLLTRFDSSEKFTGLVSIELNTIKDINSKYNKYNLVVSMFNAKNNYIQNNIEKNATDISYMKKDLSQVNPQLHKWLTIINDKSNSDTIIRKTKAKVNTSDEKSLRFSLKDSEGNTLTKEQQEFFKDSNIRDEDGNLLVVYHGTDKEFTVFDKTLALDVGMHFGTEKAAANFGKSKKYYLNAKVNKTPIEDIFSNQKYSSYSAVNILYDNELISYEDYRTIRNAICFYI